ncbi:MAG: AIR synthase related protein [Alphaproteobacteria bacterium]|nr:AIR synthase related protein [Alphaproteobacteria bacterium]
MAETITYKQSGVDYDVLDAFKRLCQKTAANTQSAYLKDVGGGVLGESRGESSFVIDMGSVYIAHVDEGLGTKNLVADAMEQAMGKAYYPAIGIDTVATIVNDVISCGALPVNINMHLAVGRSEWFQNTKRFEGLVAGFAEGCKDAGAAWGGGETPILTGIVEGDSAVIAGSCMGMIADKKNYVKGDIDAGDQIVFIASNGPHANGISLCRRIADKLPKGYLTDLGNGETFGDYILRPSKIYAGLLRDLQNKNIAIKYISNITGHGWRKLMRNRGAFKYTVLECGKRDAFYDFLVSGGWMSLEDAYGTFNMGAGCAFFVKAGDVDGVLASAKATGHVAWHAGRVEQSEGAGPSVVIEPLGITFGSDSMALRAENEAP